MINKLISKIYSYKHTKSIGFNNVKMHYNIFFLLCSATLAHSSLASYCWGKKTAWQLTCTQTTAITMATLIVHIKIHSQGHFGAQMELWKKRKKKKRRFGGVRDPVTICLNLGVGAGPADRPWSSKVQDCTSGRCGWRGGQSQGHPRCHNEISHSTSLWDNNAFNFGLPSILQFCIRVVAAGWLLVHNACTLRPFP